jgi:predicted transcriptional regulator
MSKSKGNINQLSRRERQIMDVIYRQKEASVREVLDQIENPPSYSSIRASMRILEEKGHLKHSNKDGRFVFKPTLTPEKAKRSAIHRVVETFFESSASKALSTLCHHLN